MRLYYIVSGILLIIGFAVAAPVPVQKKHQARVDVMNIPEDAMTMLRRPEGLPAAHPSSSPPPPRPANAPLSPSDGLNMFWLNLVGPPAESHIDALNKMWLNLVDHSTESHLDALNKYWLNLVGHPTESHHDALNNMWLNLIGHPESHFPPTPGELPAAHPSSIPPPQGPADGPMDVEQPLPSAPKELPQMSNQLSPDYALLSPGDALSKVSLSLVDHPESHFLQKPDDSSGAGPSSISQPSSPAGGSMDVDQRLSSIPEEPLQVSSPDHAPLSPDNSDEMNELWPDILDHRPWLDLLDHPEDSSGARPSSISQPSSPTDGSMDVKQRPPSIPEEPLQVSSPDHAPPSPVDSDEMNELWPDILDHRPLLDLLDHPEDSSSAGPSSISQPSSPTDGPMDVEQRLPSIPEKPLQVSSLDHAPPSSVDSDEMNELWPDILDNRPLLDLLDHPEDSSGARPSLVSQPSTPTDGSMDVDQRLPSNPEKPLQVSSPDHAPPSPVDSDEMNELWPDILDYRPWPNLLDHPEDSSGASTSSISQPSSPADGSMDVEQRPPSIPEEPLQVSSPDHTPPSPDDSDEMNELWPDILEHRPWLDLLDHPEDSSGARPPSVLQPSSPTDGLMDVEQRLPSIPEEPLKVFSPDHALPGPDDEMNELRPDILDHPEDSSAAHPSWGLPPSGPTHEWTHFVQWLSSVTEEASLHHAPPSPGLLTGFGNDFMNGDELHWPPFPESSTMFSADDRVMGAHAPPNPGPSTEPDDEMTDATINP